jgi:hypothetical protein
MNLAQPLFTVLILITLANPTLLLAQAVDPAEIQKIETLITGSRIERRQFHPQWFKLQRGLRRDLPAPQMASERVECQNRPRLYRQGRKFFGNFRQTLCDPFQRRQGNQKPGVSCRGAEKDRESTRGTARQRQLIQQSHSVLELKFVDTVPSPSSSFPPFGRAQDKLQEESRTPTCKGRSRPSPTKFAKRQRGGRGFRVAPSSRKRGSARGLLGMAMNYVTNFRYTTPAISDAIDC